MFKTVKYRIWPKDLNFVSGINSVVTKIKQEYGFVSTSLGEREWDNSFHVVIDDAESYGCDSEKEFYQVLDSHKVFSRFTFHLCMRKRFSITRFGLGVDFDGREVKVMAHSASLEYIDHAITTVETMLQLQKGLSSDPDPYRKKLLEPTIFVSRHFDRTGNEYYRRIERPLRLLGFDVVEGEEYAATAIPEKVKHRIEKQDIVLVVVSGVGSHEWLSAEIGYALAKSRHIVIMREQDAEFNQTILGNDYQYISLSMEKIDVALSDFLQELRMIGIKGLFN